MHTGIVPRDPRRVGVLAVEGLYSLLLPQFPDAVGGTVEIDEAGDPPAAIGLVQSPAAHVVAERDNTRANSLGDPDAYDEMPDTRGDTHEVARCDTERLSVFAVDPERVGVADLVQVLRVTGAGVDHRRQPERRDQHHVARVLVEPVVRDVRLDVARRRVLGPAEVG